MNIALDRHHEDRLVAGFAALAISIHLLEAAVPMPLPGVKPGLANVVILILLLRYNFGIAAQVMLLRVLCGSLLLGTFMTPTFWLSVGGASASLFSLWLVDSLARGWIGPVGLAVTASMAHMAGQVLLAWLVFLPHPGVLALLPILLTAALGLGIMTGIIAAKILARLPARTIPASMENA